MKESDARRREYGLAGRAEWVSRGLRRRNPERAVVDFLSYWADENYSKTAAPLSRAIVRPDSSVISVVNSRTMSPSAQFEVRSYSCRDSFGDVRIASYDVGGRRIPII